MNQTRRPAEEHPFRELGLDSLGGIELHRLLTLSTGIPLPVTVVFEYPSPATLAQHLLALVRGTEPAAAEGVVPPSVIGEEPLAIVGMSCRYPGGIGSPEDLWQAVCDERDVIGDFPGDRGWDLESVYDADPGRHGKTNASRDGFLAEAAYFDPAFFGISPREAAAMDPQQRLVPWVISARSEAALADQAARLLAHAETRPGLRPADVGYSLGTTRSALDRRAVILGREAGDFTRALTACVGDEQDPGLIRGAMPARWS